MALIVLRLGSVRSLPPANHRSTTHLIMAHESTIHWTSLQVCLHIHAIEIGISRGVLLQLPLHLRHTVLKHHLVAWTLREWRPHIGPRLQTLLLWWCGHNVIGSNVICLVILLERVDRFDVGWQVLELFLLGLLL